MRLSVRDPALITIESPSAGKMERLKTPRMMDIDHQRMRRLRYQGLANTSILSAERVAVLRGVVEVCVPVLVVSSSLGNEFSSGSGNKASFGDFELV
jgi:hypothetical protein